MNDADHMALKTLLADRLGFRVGDLDEATVHGALQAAVKAHHGANAEATLAHLAVRDLSDPIWQVVIDRFVVTETSFLRDRDWCDSLAGEALATLVKARRADGTRRLHLWSAGCSTGEECYTLAFLVDRLVPDRSEWDIRIVGSDVCRANLGTATKGIYRAWKVRTLSEPERAHLFDRVDGRHYRVHQRFRDMVTFRQQNLADLKPLEPGTGEGRFDLIVCRNVLIYFERERQDRLARALISRLTPDGWLAVAPAEASAERFAPLARVSTSCAIFFRARQDAATPAEPAIVRMPAAEELRPAAAIAAPATMPPAPSIEPPARRPIAWPSPESLPGSLPKSLPEPMPEPPQQPAAGVSAPPLAPASPDQPNAVGGHRGNLEHARLLADRGELEEARRRCLAVLEEDSLCHDAHVLLAMIALEADEMEEALTAARRAAYVRTDSPMAHLLEGMALLRLRQHRQAHRCLDRAMRMVELTSDPELAEMTAEFGIDALLDMARTHLAQDVPTAHRRSDARRQ
ncbi:MAG: hypothetical protein H6843_14355 [Rhodospirillaceae bacterium]|nr:hypothetical protein [Rhodospirillaceae bacterium]